MTAAGHVQGEKIRRSEDRTVAPSTLRTFIAPCIDSVGLSQMVRLTLLSSFLPVIVAGDWVLTFEDDFVGTSLNTTVWLVRDNFTHGSQGEEKNSPLPLSKLC